MIAFASATWPAHPLRYTFSATKPLTLSAAETDLLLLIPVLTLYLLSPSPLPSLSPFTNSADLTAFLFGVITTTGGPSLMRAESDLRSPRGWFRGR
jgi:hypothetical protein